MWVWQLEMPAKPRMEPQVQELRTQRATSARQLAERFLSSAVLRSPWSLTPLAGVASASGSNWHYTVVLKPWTYGDPIGQLGQ